jgi:hypothetical protein
MHELYGEYLKNWHHCNSICCNVNYSQYSDKAYDSLESEEKIDFIIERLRDATMQCTWIECLSHCCIGGSQANSLGRALLETMSMNHIVAFCITIINLYMYDQEASQSLRQWIETSSSLEVIWLDAYEQFREPLEQKPWISSFTPFRSHPQFEGFP